MRCATLALALLLATATQAAASEAPSRGAQSLDRRDWAEEVRLIRSAERQDLGMRARALREARTGSEQVEAQRFLEAGKLEWRRRLLGAQLARARAAGLGTQAQVLERRLADLDAVAARRLPVAPAGEER